MSARYTRVASRNADSTQTAEQEARKRQRSQLAERVSTKMHALIWVVIGGAVMYRTDFFNVLLHDDRVDRYWFNIATATFTINCVIMFYLSVWLPGVQRVKVPWSIYCPRMIPAATVIGIICGVTLTLALWSVWGFLTPLVLASVFLGFLFCLHFVPWPC
ncbi:unnamed protein product [Chrysoparadoxa australica]